MSYTLICSTFKSIHFIENIKNVQIDGYSSELIQVLINILNNARDEIKIKKIKGLIFVDIYKDEKNAYIKIKDNAGGIPEDIKDKIFDSHFTTKKNSFGSGIGLYMSRRIIIKSFNGMINVENVRYNYKEKEYTGAMFTIVLPL